MMVLCAFLFTAGAALVIYYMLFMRNSDGKKVKKSKNTDEPAPYFFRHCEKPTVEPVTGVIKGQIPSWLEGTLTRNGPGIMKIGQYEYNHIFDGLAVLHRFDIKDGKATYTSRALESDTKKRNEAANRIVVGEFGTGAFPDPCQSIFEKYQSKFSSLLKTGADDMMTDNCSVNVAYYGDQLYAMTETNFVRRIDPVDLTTVGEKTKISDFVAVNSATAHPHVLEDGTVLNTGMSYQGKTKLHYCLIGVPPSFNSEETSFKNAKLLAQIPFGSKRFPCYFHSFGLAGKDIGIFIESPLRIDLIKLAAAGLVQKSYAECMTWKPSLKTRFYVVSLSTGRLHPIVYEADPFFTFHHINAYQDKDDQLVVDVAAYPRGDRVLAWDSNVHDSDVTANNPIATRFILPLNIPIDAKTNQNLVTLEQTKATAKLQKSEGDRQARVFLTGEHLADNWMELPRINYKLNGQKYNFVYGASGSQSITSNDIEPDSIIKIDINKKEVKKWAEKGMAPSEPIFVPNPNAQKDDEDDGVVLTALMHKNEEAAVTLLVLNAKDLTEVARVDFKTAGAFTGTFHGQWAGNGSKLHFY